MDLFKSVFSKSQDDNIKSQLSQNQKKTGAFQTSCGFVLLILIIVVIVSMLGSK